MKPHDHLRAVLERIDGSGYKAYRELKGAWDFGDFVLHVDHAQADPFAPPSRVRATMSADAAGLPAASYRTRPRALGTAAWLARRFEAQATERAESVGSGSGGAIEIAAPRQTVVEQTALRVGADGSVEARFGVGLPARGRRVLGSAAVHLLSDVVPGVVRAALAAGSHDEEAVELHAATNEDAEHLRAALEDRGLVAFVADRAVLPRRSGVDPRPLEGGAVPFVSPESLRVTLEAPHAGSVTGMGIPRGVTLIIGGGFHGKSTLLRAVEAGVYNHRPGDGRERVVTTADAVKVRAEDGRAVAGVDITMFIDGLPLGADTRAFTSSNASGSTSQAAGIMEALEAGATALLIDEDTSATNFMIRDRRMQALVPGKGEPITPFIDRVRTLYERDGVSSVLVLGGSGDYLDVADTVVRMDAYRARDVTADARLVAQDHPTGRQSEAAPPGPRPAPRAPRPGSMDPRKGRRERYVRIPDTRTLRFGRQDVDLAALEQLVGREQIRSVGLALARVAVLADGRLGVPELLDRVLAEVADRGLDALDARRPGDLAAFRRHELAAAMNRLRTLVVC